MRPAALAAAGALLLLGLLGLLPGATTRYGDLAFAGRGSGAELFGVFRVSIALDLIHLLLGAPGVLLARTADGARAYLAGAGAACLVLWLVGVAGVADGLPLDRADNWLHFGLGGALLGLGFAAARA